MAYKVQLPPDLEEETPRVSLPFFTGNHGNRIDEGPIVAVLICSHVLQAEIWLALEEDWKPDPDDKRAVFYATELEFLKNKTPAELRAIHKVRLVFGAGSRVRK